MVECVSHAGSSLDENVRRLIRNGCGELRPERIVIKPNWVLHETDPAFPIAALVTDSRVIRSAIESCLQLYPGCRSIVIGDCPLQYADWPLLCRQSGIDLLMEEAPRRYGGRVEFRDLRKDVYDRDDASFLEVSKSAHGDPRGYREVELGLKSHLEPISAQSRRFAVNDYRASVTASNHGPGRHRYLVSQTVLDADLIINLPKWKSHQKSGLTAALKNLVGINGDKAYLPHFRRGAPKWGGDEYEDAHRWMYWTQTRLRELLQKRNRLLYHALKPGWEMIKRLRGIETRMTSGHSGKRYYIAGGSWHGNETIWRMIYDLNLIVQCVDRDGNLRDSPQRDYFCLVDGLISGEGNGPLQPLPKKTDWLVAGHDPFAIDAVLGQLMGFELERLPLIRERAAYAGPDWGDFALEGLEFRVDGKPTRLLECDINFSFLPPPGWRDYIER